MFLRDGFLASGSLGAVAGEERGGMPRKRITDPVRMFRYGRIGTDAPGTTHPADPFWLLQVGKQ